MGFLPGMNLLLNCQLLDFQPKAERESVFGATQDGLLAVCSTQRSYVVIQWFW